MKTFSEYLLNEETTPEPKGKALKHLRHVEDNVLYDGHPGVEMTDHHLSQVHNSLLGKRSLAHISTKMDGAPSVVFGHHPETKQFFVASKSAFNKTPKINYTKEDIQKNHGHAPGLVDKLSAALEHLPKITPSHGVYQGDLMHSHSDAKTNKGMTSITPNTITYSAPKDSAEGKSMNKKLGIVVHTHYKGGKSLDTMNAGPLDSTARKNFKDHPDVNNIDPTSTVNPSNYSSDEQRQYLEHMENAKNAYGKMKPEAMDQIAGHGPSLENYINSTVRSGETPSVDGYKNHITSRHEKDIASLKSPAGIDKKMQGHAAAIQYVNDNKDHFKNTLDLHNHFQKAKDVLTGVMAKNSPYTHTVDGTPTGPEGSVVVDRKNNASKFVNRAEFSRQNFLRSSYQKKKEENE